MRARVVGDALARCGGRPTPRSRSRSARARTPPRRSPATPTSAPTVTQIHGRASFFSGFGLLERGYEEAKSYRWYRLPGGRDPNLTVGSRAISFADALLRVPPDALHRIGSRVRRAGVGDRARTRCTTRRSATSSTTATSTSSIYAEELGFDGVCVNEHHQNAYGNMPSPNLIASILARQTTRVKIAVVGNALPLYDPPTRVAEEFAMIDVISGGRLIAGMVVGGGPEYYSFSVNPTHARERFREAHDLIMKAWTEPGPFECIGKHYQLRYVNPWPRPLQQPHPRDLDPRRGLARDDRVRGPATTTRTWASRTSTSTCSSATSRCSATRARPRATPPTRSRRAGSCRSTSPRPTSRPARSTRSTSGTS